jgi:hypothetical protein
VETRRPRASKNPLRFLGEHPEFNSREVAQRDGRTHAVCMGDSHIKIFNHIQGEKLIPWAWFDVVIAKGATAQGLVNPRSVSDGLRMFRRRVGAAEPWQHLVYLLGEVDCGYLVWYRAQKEGVSVESQVDTSLANYGALLREVAERGFERISVLSVPLPTISDGQDWGEVANARLEVKATQRERTELTLAYNERLSEMCASVPATFVDITSEQLDPETGIVASSLINPNTNDHHLSEPAYAEIVARKLGPALKPS